MSENKQSLAILKLSNTIDQVRLEISKVKSTGSDGEIYDGMLVEAASSYGFHALTEKHKDTPPPMWPFRDEFWKPSEDKIENLLKATAILCLEIDRIEDKRSIPQA